MASRAEFAEHIGVKNSVVNDLVRKSIIQERSDGTGIDIDEARLDYIAHLRSVAGNKSGNPVADLNLSKERARKAKEEADRLEMANAQTRGELLARGDVDAAVTAAVARVRAKMLSVPTKVAAEAMIASTPAEAEAIIRAAVCESLAELASTKVADLMAQESDED